MLPALVKPKLMGFTTTIFDRSCDPSGNHHYALTSSLESFQTLCRFLCVPNSKPVGGENEFHLIHEKFHVYLKMHFVKENRKKKDLSLLVIL